MIDRVLGKKYRSCFLPGEVLRLLSFWRGHSIRAINLLNFWMLRINFPDSDIVVGHGRDLPIANFEICSGETIKSSRFGITFPDGGFTATVSDSGNLFEKKQCSATVKVVQAGSTCKLELMRASNNEEEPCRIHVYGIRDLNRQHRSFEAVIAKEMMRREIDPQQFIECGEALRTIMASRQELLQKHVTYWPDCLNVQAACDAFPTWSDSLMNANTMIDGFTVALESEANTIREIYRSGGRDVKAAGPIKWDKMKLALGLFDDGQQIVDGAAQIVEAGMRPESCDVEALDPIADDLKKLVGCVTETDEHFSLADWQPWKLNEDIAVGSSSELLGVFNKSNASTMSLHSIKSYALQSRQLLKGLIESNSGAIFDATKAKQVSKSPEQRIKPTSQQETAKRDGDGTDFDLIDSPNDERDKWLRDQKEAGELTLKQIRAKLKNDFKDWTPLSNDSSLNAAIKRYEKRKKLPTLPKRKSKN